MRDEILARFPLEYRRYIEVFGGAGWVLFHKPPGSDFEVFNDFNGNLVNLYRCVREQPDKLKNELRYMLNSRLDFEYIKQLLHSQAVLPDIRRAACYYAIIRYSYAAGTSTFGSQPHSLWNDFPPIDAAAGRLQKVVIENKDCVKLIRQYDRPDSFFTVIRHTTRRINIMRRWVRTDSTMTVWHRRCFRWTGSSCCPTTTAHISGNCIPSRVS